MLRAKPFTAGAVAPARRTMAVVAPRPLVSSTAVMGGLRLGERLEGEDAGCWRRALGWRWREALQAGPSGMEAGSPNCAPSRPARAQSARLRAPPRS
jgi:hypothetical protein